MKRIRRESPWLAKVAWAFIGKTSCGTVVRGTQDRLWLARAYDPQYAEAEFRRRVDAKRWVECQIAKVES